MRKLLHYRQWGVTPKLIVLLMLFGLIPLGIVGLLTYQTGLTLQEKVGEKFETTAKTIGETIDRNLAERYSDVQAFALNEVIRRTYHWYDTDQDSLLAELLNRLVKHYKVYSLSILVDPQGDVIAVNNQDALGHSISTEFIFQKNYRHAPWFEALTANQFTTAQPFSSKDNRNSTGTFIEDVHVDEDVVRAYPGDDGLTIGFSAPVYGERGEVIAYWTNRTKFSVIEEIFVNVYAALKKDGYRGAELTLLDGQGNVLFDYDPVRQGNLDVLHDFQSVLFTLNLVKEGVSMAQEAVMGRSGYGNALHVRKDVLQTGGYTHLQGALGYPGMNWSVLVRIPYVEAIAESNSLISQVWFASFVCLIFLLPIGTLVGRRITNRIKEIEASAEKALAGDYSHVLEVTHDDELGHLSRTLNGMNDSIQQVIISAQQVANGEYDVNIVPRGESDALGHALKNMTTALRAGREQERRQEWINNGRMGLADVKRGEQDLPILCRKIIGFFAGYLNASVGVIYVADDAGRFQLMGSYAYTQRKHLQSEIHPGEGLVGQAVLEKSPILLTAVPDDYMSIQSGLGEQVPRNILVYPLMVDQTVVGVLELGSFHAFTDDHQELIRQSSGHIAVAIRSAQSRHQITQLLSDTQAQAEQLQKQQEELWASNQELECQTDALRTSEAELKVNTEELRATNEELQKQSKALELQKHTVEVAKREIEVKAHELEVASKYKSEFLANMSHELRTPLNSLLVLAQTLKNNDDGNLTEDQIDSLNVIHSGGTDLLVLINDILDLSKVEAGRLTIHMETVNLQEVVTSLRKQFQPIADQSGLTFETSVQSGIGPVLETDRLRLEQILKNLLSNALKFTPSGTVTLTVHRPEPTCFFQNGHLTHSTAIAFSVADSGIGIPQDKRLAIFEAFQQADGTTTRLYGGTGLGLTISRELTRKLGGEIHLDSQEGKGSTFTLYLPINHHIPEDTTQANQGRGAFQVSQFVEKVASLSSNVENAQLDQRGSIPPVRAFPVFLPDDRDQWQDSAQSLLLIDHDAVSAQQMMTMAKQAGYLCLCAGTGRVGVQMACAYRPTMILLDPVLPDIEGLEVLRQLKGEMSTRHIPVALANHLDEPRAMLQDGAMGYLTKPVQDAEFFAVLAQVERINAGTPKEILIVEDDEVTRKATEQLIHHEGIHIRSVSTGQEALTHVQANPCDLMILDLKLPDMSGFELLTAMGDHFGGTLPSVIVYTGRDVTPEEHRQLSEQTSCIVVKSVDSPGRLLDEVLWLVHARASSLSNTQLETIKEFHDCDDLLKDKKVLVVDDDLRNSFAVSKILKERHMQVLIADSGPLALEKLEADPDIALVLMDIMMPKMDGYSVMQHIREHARGEELPIIALTAKVMADEQNRCLSAGANDYLPKPVDAKQLFAAMRVWLLKSSYNGSMADVGSQ